MMRRTRTNSWLVALAAVGCILAAVPALADSILPVSVTGTLSVGASATIRKTVTISAGTPTTAQGDVFFLTDATGSMGGTIGDVQDNATAILAGLSVYGNIQTGAGSYRDFNGSPWGGDYEYRLDAAIDGAASTQAGINTWSAAGGATHQSPSSTRSRQRPSLGRPAGAPAPRSSCCGSATTRATIRTLIPAIPARRWRTRSAHSQRTA